MLRLCPEVASQLPLQLDPAAIKRFYFLTGKTLTFDAFRGQFTNQFLSLEDFGLTGLSANPN